MFNKYSVLILCFLLIFITSFTEGSWIVQSYKINPTFEKALQSNKIKYDLSDKITMRILSEYGAVFTSQMSSIAPPYVIFPDENSVSKWQESVKPEHKKMNGINVVLQASAMKALINAQTEAREKGISITPNGTTASTRSYAETARLWKSRVDPGLNFHVKQKHISQAEAEAIRKLSPSEQIPEILKLEAKGYFFSKSLDKSILYSVAAVGTSQHISMLALDVTEHTNSNVRNILAKYGWFQTVVSDQPHFTYIGVTEDKLPSLGLKKVTNDNRVYWIPDIDTTK
jgi:hypothetical protein